MKIGTGFGRGLGGPKPDSLRAFTKHRDSQVAILQHGLATILLCAPCESEYCGFIKSKKGKQK